ncbi:efflux RND transporter periplasmic adaptor subunit, partial [Marinomonas sp.]|uniref:efflux RND transporter periplasmic adaptor subunit n=1 Tax=Marinomonas sp. TaxID=1904862 RepID=UPI003C764DDD
MKMLKTIGFFVLAGAFFTTGYFFAQHTDSSESTATDSASSTPTLPAKPLYWVAPMDANYRRDKPGKSPMGMDLVPFYGTQKQAEAGVGTIRISPDVVNNLGVRSAAAFTGYLENAIRTVGYLAYNDDSLVHVHSRVEGWVEKSFVKSDGDFVEKGQPLFDLYSPALVNAQKEFVFALKRQDQPMISAGAARLSALNVSQVLIDELRTTRKVSQTVRFYAPQSGVIERLGVQEGFYIKPGTTLMSIVNLSEVWLNVDVFERQAHQVEIGQEVNATLAALPGKTFNSKVD